MNRQSEWRRSRTNTSRARAKLVLVSVQARAAHSSKPPATRRPFELGPAEGSNGSSALLFGLAAPTNPQTRAAARARAGANGPHLAVDGRATSEHSPPPSACPPHASERLLPAQTGRRRRQPPASEPNRSRCYWPTATAAIKSVLLFICLSSSLVQCVANEASGQHEKVPPDIEAGGGRPPANRSAAADSLTIQTKQGLFRGVILSDRSSKSDAGRGDVVGFLGELASSRWAQFI